MILGCSIFLGCFFGTKPLNSPMQQPRDRDRHCVCTSWVRVPNSLYTRYKTCWKRNNIPFIYDIWQNQYPLKCGFKGICQVIDLKTRVASLLSSRAILTRPSNLAMNWTDKKSNASKDSSLHLDNYNGTTTRAKESVTRNSSQKALGQHMSLRHFWVVGKHHQVQSKIQSLTRGWTFLLIFGFSHSGTSLRHILGCQIYHLDLIMLNIPKDPYFWGRSCWVFRPYKKNTNITKNTGHTIHKPPDFLPKMPWLIALKLKKSSAANSCSAKTRCTWSPPSVERPTCAKHRYRRCLVKGVIICSRWFFV